MCRCRGTSTARASWALWLVATVAATLPSVGTAAYLTDTWLVGQSEIGREDQLKGKFVTATLPTGQKLPVYVASPEGSASAPLVIVAHHAVGIYHATFLRSFADDLARQGYVAVLPDFFHRAWGDGVPTGAGMPFENMNIGRMLGSLRDEEVIEDLEAVLQLVAATRMQGSSTQRAILGFCMGGRISWLAAVDQRFKGRIHAAIPYHGGNVYKTWPAGTASKGPGDRIADLHCPVLGHFGSVDKNPSPEDMDQMQGVAETHGKSVKFLVHAGADHGFSCKDSAKYVEARAREAWDATLSFLAEQLGSAPPRSDL